jgi:hypothetical protein
MRRWPKCFAIFLTLCISAGCKQQQKQKPSGPQIIYAGLGFSNRLEIGMTLAEVAKRNPDAEFNREFRPGTPFWARPFKTPSGIEIKVPSLGAESWVSHDTQSIAFLTFHLGLLPPSILRNGSNEVLFTTGKPVFRHRAVYAFGEPQRHVTDLLQTVLYRSTGEAVSRTDSGLEQLYYPLSGAHFALTNNVVAGFAIEKRFDSRKGTFQRVDFELWNLNPELRAIWVQEPKAVR